MHNSKALAHTLAANVERVQSAFLAMPDNPRLHAAIALQMLRGMVRAGRYVEEYAATLPDGLRTDVLRKWESLAYPVERLDEYFAGVKSDAATAHHIDRQTAAIFVFYIGHQCKEIGELIQQ